MSSYRIGQQFWPKDDDEYKSWKDYFSDLNNKYYKEAYNEASSRATNKMISGTPTGKRYILYVEPLDSIAYALRDIGAKYHEERVSYQYYDVVRVSRKRTETKVKGYSGSYDKYRDRIDLKPVEESKEYTEYGLEIRNISYKYITYKIYAVYYNPSLISEAELKIKINTLSRDSLSFHEELKSRQTMGGKYKNMTAFTRWSAVLLILTFVLNIGLFLSFIILPFVVKPYHVYILGGLSALTIGIDIANQVIIRKLNYYFLEHEIGDYYQYEWQLIGLSSAFLCFLLDFLIKVPGVSWIYLIIIIIGLAEAGLFIFFNVHQAYEEGLIFNLWDAGKGREFSHKKMAGDGMSRYLTKVNDIKKLL